MRICVCDQFENTTDLSSIVPDKNIILHIYIILLYFMCVEAQI